MFGMKRNNLSEEKEGYLNHIFFAVRNAKVNAFIWDLTSRLEKKGFNVDIEVDNKRVDIVLHNNSKTSSWTSLSSYFYLEGNNTHYSSDQFSTWTFSMGSHHITSHFGARLPNYVNDFWNEVKQLFADDYFSPWIKEFNYPFNGKVIDENEIDVSKALLKVPKDFIPVAVSEGEKAGLITSVKYLESILMQKGFHCDGAIKGNVFEFTLYNTKRGKWDQAGMIIGYSHEAEKSTWLENFHVHKTQLNDIQLIKPNEKETKHYTNFEDFVNSEEFKEHIDKALYSLHYPFLDKSYLNC